MKKKLPKQYYSSKEQGATVQGWKCFKCGTQNHSTKKTCRRCGAPK